MAKLRIGARSLVYALLNESTDVVGGTPTWGTVYPMGNPLLDEIDVTPSANSTTFYGDNAAREIGETYGETDVDIKFGDIANEDLARILGHTYSNGGYSTSPNDVSPWVAIGFIATLTGGYSEYQWLYKGRFQKMAGKYVTKKGQIVWNVPELKGKFVPMNSTDTSRYLYRTDDATATSAITSGFFSAPYLPSADTGALSCTIAKGTAGDAGKVVVTFSKVGGGTFSIASAFAAAPFANVSDISGTARAGAWAVSGAGATVTFKFTPTVAFTGSENISTLIQGVQDSFGITVATNGKILVY